MVKRDHNQGGGPSQRQKRVAELIKRELAELLARGDHYEPELEGKLISVVDVTCSPDLRVAKVRVIPYGGDAAEAVAALDRIKGSLRQELNHRLALKFSPELRFEEDKSHDYADATMAKLREITRDD